MKHETILFISSQKTSSNSILAAVKATGCRVVSSTSTQAIALLFIMHCVAAVLVDRAGSDNTSFDLPGNLRAICPNAPIILLSPTPISPLPSHVDACVSTASPLTNVTSAVLRVLALVGNRHKPDSLQQAS